MTTISNAGPDTVAQMAGLIDRFSRMLSIMPAADLDPFNSDDRADQRAMLLAAGLFAVADQLQRIGDALTAPLPDAPLEIPVGGDDDRMMITE